MGKATILVGLCMFFGIISTLVALGIQSVDPSSPLLASNKLYGSFNMVYSEMNTSSSSWQLTKDYTSSAYLPGREATGQPSASSTQYPDWVYSGVKWITTGFSVILNCIGAPYTISVMIAPNNAGATIGTGLAILNLFIIVGWMLGKID